MARQRPEPFTEYAAAPTAEYVAHGVSEAARSLAAFLGTTQHRAMDLLQDGAAEEIRSRLANPLVARRRLERRYADPSMLP